MGWWLRVSVVGCFCLLQCAVAWKAYVSGRASGKAEMQALWNEQSLSAERAVRAEEEKNKKIAQQTMSQLAEATAKERVIYRDIIKEVPTYVPSDLPVLPGSFRVLHDAAATGSELPEAGSAGGVDATAVPVIEIAATIAKNYAACRLDQIRLEALHKILRLQIEDEVSQITDPTF